MSVTTFSSRDFTRDVSAAKRAAHDGPVFITDRGQPAYALLRIEEYYQLTSQKPRTLLEAMEAMPGGDFEFDPPRLTDAVQPADLD